MRIACVVGTRPNFVKIAPLLREMRREAALEPLLIHTGQHSDAEMSGSFFRDLEIPPPDVSLGAGEGATVSETRAILDRMEPVLLRERPDMVLVVGDVNSTLAAALAATRLGIPIAHVEAGLRSFDLRMPEEMNRILTDALSQWLFVSEPSGVDNLRKEGVPAEQIFLVGNVMIDSLREAMSKATESPIHRDLGLAERAGLSSCKPYAVLTLHRQGLVDDPNLFMRVWRAIQLLAREVAIIFPVHPRTQKRIREFAAEFRAADDTCGVGTGIRLIRPLGYLDFLQLERMASLVLTDSGGVQEEASALGVPCLTLRENTERPLTVTQGTNKVVGLDPARILSEARRALSEAPKGVSVLPFWDGQASRRITRILCALAGEGEPPAAAHVPAMPDLEWVVA